MRDALDPHACPAGAFDNTNALDVLDARLMRILLVLLTERTVSRAAVRLNMSQPATSAALKRLRTLLGDPLLVRSRYGMVPTEFGARLIEPLRNALRVIDFIRIQQPRFDARTSVRTYRIGCPDYLNVLFVPKLVALFRERAPNAQLVFHPLGDGFDDERALADGELDLVIDNRPARLSRFRQDHLFDDRVVCLMRATHPLARRGTMTATDFANAPQLCPTPSWLEASGAIDRQLERVGLQRRIVVTLPHFELAAHALVRSDLLLTTTYRLARHYAKLLPLGVVALPADPPDIAYRMTWNEAGSCVEGVHWLRGLVAEATQSWLGAEAVQPAVAAIPASKAAAAVAPEPARTPRRRHATQCGKAPRAPVARVSRPHRLPSKSH
ncbi:LysR family transcriptional regulator [Burkholderia pseudomultivorans]|uniref:HTH-type transcriptional regulator SyrM 1 n=1 Tax=Burkholderia pseudomultivorans TaxID=1207504 RepID=A0ABU2E0M9_9BURK|nr:LysR family transcriptional regulator [Burkholderia pseudomultivorans]MDR8727387.1 HTH-type transcriptional regulator SyrM 1 [Burkholderia pseudomultivorans]MDR8732521.1 HTH-type transcriptional regulator SyrM 1 [Burkholderia pseudomultivorans]MDR8739387.1 HTH-type transcriptional regulator SyrM 1 [Burkholderia pseudomultivorans]MDR8753417.1 HTH-type transcriptional regulator SyrM 1 [Burkholderia pseudomultivorans]MDR8775385.1 HTH-type transcriptional regulator SyrM 1 [Burkholderia pseudomu